MDKKTISQKSAQEMKFTLESIRAIRTRVFPTREILIETLQEVIDKLIGL